MEDDSKLAQKQFGAIKRSIKLGRTLQIDHPGIDELYHYYSQTEIPGMLNIQTRYEVNESIARNGVYYAMKGHDGSSGIKAYPPLIDEDERKWLGREHNILGSRKLEEEGKGMFERTPEQVSKDSRESYKASLGKRTSEQRKEDAESINPETGERYRVEAGRKSVIAKGFTPWGDEEKKDAYEMSLKTEYQHPENSSYAGKTKIKSITLALNTKHHKGKEVRNSQSVIHQLAKHRKSLEAEVD